MTTLTSGTLLAIATFSNVFLLVFQQQNVHHRYLRLGIVTSAALSICYVSIVLLMIEIQWASLFFIIPSGCAGFLASMYAHPYISRIMRDRKTRLSSQ